MSPNSFFNALEVNCGWYLHSLSIHLLISLLWLFASSSRQLKLPLTRTFFDFPWRFELAGVNWIFFENYYYYYKWIVKVNCNYFTLYKALRLKLKIIWSKRVNLFVCLWCRIFIRRSHGSRLSATVKSDSICFYWNGWMKIDRSYWYTNHVQWYTNHVKGKVKSTITADS